MKVSFIGDIMLGRFVQEKYRTKEYDLVKDGVCREIRKSDYVVANLESPLTDCEATNSLAFAGDLSMLDKLKWIDCFSLANNHINDFGEKGMTDTIAGLEHYSFSYNGLYKEKYYPFLIEHENNRIAVIMCTDMLNYEFDEKCQYHVLRADSTEVNATISEYSAIGYFVILFAHCGSLFSRFPNPEILELLYSAIDAGAGCVVTAHSHCLGGEHLYKGVPIFWSLGDFLMDGGSYRRRRSCILTLEVENNQLKGWGITPTITNSELQVDFPAEKEKAKLTNSYAWVSRVMAIPRKNYKSFYKVQYKKEMVQHSMSTLHFLYATKGLKGFLKMLRVRYYAVYRMIHRLLFDRSKGRYDKDGINPKHLLNNNDIK